MASVDNRAPCRHRSFGGQLVEGCSGLLGLRRGQDFCQAVSGSRKTRQNSDPGVRLQPLVTAAPSTTEISHKRWENTRHVARHYPACPACRRARPRTTPVSRAHPEQAGGLLLYGAIVLFEDTGEILGRTVRPLAQRFRGYDAVARCGAADPRWVVRTQPGRTRQDRVAPSARPAGASSVMEGGKTVQLGEGG